MRWIAAVLAFLFLAVSLEAAEIAVIPYRVENSSDGFGEQTGDEYAKLSVRPRSFANRRETSTRSSSA